LKKGTLVGIAVVLLTLSSLDGISFVTKAESLEDLGSFDFKEELFGSVSTLNVQVASLDKETGEVMLYGADSRGPTIPFTWEWGDGSTSEGWFPQTHTYIDTKRNYVAKVTAHYVAGENSSFSETIVRFTYPSVVFKIDAPDVAVSIPDHQVTLTNRLSGYVLPSTLTYFDDSSFGLVNRSVIEYVLTVAAAIQNDFANDNVFQIDGGFRQIILRDPPFSGMYSLWYTSPVSLVAGDVMFEGSIPWSSFFHEMGHDVTLNSPVDFFYGGKIDGDANAIFSESMAQIFQHATAYELANNAEEWGLGSDLVFDIKQSARQSIRQVRNSYDNYVSSGKKFCCWNNPATQEDETCNTFMTVAYEFLSQVENSQLGYLTSLKRMMRLLQIFGEDDRVRYDQYNNTPEGDAFRSTLMVTAISYAFEKDLRSEFRDLNFPVNDEVYAELAERANAPNPTAAPDLTPIPSPAPTTAPSPTPTPTPAMTDVPTSATPTISPEPTTTTTSFPSEAFYAAAIIGITSTIAIVLFAWKKQKR